LCLHQLTNAPPSLSLPHLLPHLPNYCMRDQPLWALHLQNYVGVLIINPTRQNASH
jgi:hypothetical protein